ncbi:D-alanyl-D-alanine carboxypeptidase/D-alanyl-D-alanine-endopeptidase [candidate division WOR-3 bacterium]|nr:D-alanyl-D-alanine carboxypeptidase/D-alanyl-D-alanine-endopeptidase [candidate division WOR-3 bacterium]
MLIMLNHLLVFFFLTSAVNSSKIDGFIRSLGPVHSGIHCVNTKTGESVYSYNQDFLFVPASVQKLLTVAGSFFILGTDYRFSTYLLCDSIRSDTVYNLVLRGSGDPSLDLKSIELLVKHLKSIDINNIQGDICTYSRDLDTLPLGVGWMWDEGYYAYSARISALSCCGNYVTVKAAVTDGRITYDIMPKSDFVELVNLLAPGTENKYTVERYFDGEINIIVLSGTLKTPIERTVNLERPDLFTGHLFMRAAIESGISFQGMVRSIQTLPAVYETAAVFVSPPLFALSDSILNYSLNLSSELLLRKIASLNSLGASSLEGISLIFQKFSYLGLSTSGIVSKDGCGLSRYNLLSPRFLTSLLSLMLKQPGTSNLFFNCLPIMGREGTVNNRLRRISEDRARAKTGTLSGISTIAGYIVTKRQDTLSFAIMMNNFSISQNQIKNVQDSIILELMNY